MLPQRHFGAGADHGAGRDVGALEPPEPELLGATAKDPAERGPWWGENNCEDGEHQGKTYEKSGKIGKNIW